MFDTEIRRMSGVLAGVMIIWIFGQLVLITPLINAVEDMVIDNKTEHNLIIEKLQGIDNRVHKNKTQIDKTKPLLFRVISDCKEHHEGIEECRADFWSIKAKGN